MTRAVLLAHVLAALAGILHAQPALAGAWTRAQGEGQVILSYSLGLPPMSSLVSGGKADAQTSFVSLYGEYGVLDGLTLGGTVFLEIPSGADADHTANAGAFVRKRLWQREAVGDVASVQLGYVVPFDDSLGRRWGGEFASTTHEVSLRAQYGRGFWGDWGTAFVSTEAGFHYKLDDDEDDLRFDLSAGYAFAPCCMVIVSAFSTIPLGQEDANQLKIVPSFAYTLEGDEEREGFGLRPLTLQLSISQDVLSPSDGVGVQFSIWKSF
ncbi:MAG: hypothetical protein AAGI34_06245 [Pseudomonadota bacterium]